MVGQERIKNKLKSYSLGDFPRTLLFVGEAGCGKRTLANDLAAFYKIPLEDITESLSVELFDQIAYNPFPNFYLINLTSLTDEKQNILLKFIEEPFPSAYLILISENKLNIIPTVLNRCLVFEFEQYTKEELRPFLFCTGYEQYADTILEVCRTPGQLVNLDVKSVPQIIDISEKIATRLKGANFANTLTIADKINYKDEYDKFDINLFFDILTYVLKNKYIENCDLSTYTLYNKTVEFRKRLRDKRLNKEVFMYNFLTNLWRAARE